jgi:hypothetical protein
MADPTAKTIGDFYREIMSEWDKELFRVAYSCAQTAALYIDISCRTNFKKSTGTLANSFNAVPAIRKGQTITAGAYSPLPYAAIRETGGTIKPKNAKALAIPLTKGAKNVGSPKLWQPYNALKYIPPKSSDRTQGGILALKKGKSIKGQYALRGSVTQKGSGYLTWAQKHAGPEMDKVVGDAFVKLFATVRVPGVK